MVDPKLSMQNRKIRQRSQVFVKKIFDPRFELCSSVNPRKKLPDLNCKKYYMTLLQSTHGRILKEAPSELEDFMRQNNDPIEAHDFIGWYIA